MNCSFKTLLTFRSVLQTYHLPFSSQFEYNTLLSSLTFLSASSCSLGLSFLCDCISSPLPLHHIISTKLSRQIKINFTFQWLFFFIVFQADDVIENVYGYKTNLKLFQGHKPAINLGHTFYFWALGTMAKITCGLKHITTIRKNYLSDCNKHKEREVTLLSG